MKRHAIVLVSSLVIAVGLTAVRASALRQTPTASPDLTVHEWGTFTSVAGADGQSQVWHPLQGPEDLPCFVTKLNPDSVKVSADLIASGFNGATWRSSISATVRMETPVLYFYTQRAQDVDVHVKFPQGVISEWYPQAVVPPTPSLFYFSDMTGQATWKHVMIRPGAAEHFPGEDAPSHYYAARDTDAAPVQVGNQQEKFLFYRGLAAFPVNIAATVAPNGAIDVAQTGDAPATTAILFEKRGDKFGYRVVNNLAAHSTIARPELTASFKSLRKDLEQTLVAQGLYAKEAAAMVNTWRDSWFEEGTRLFYFLPQPAVDQILPLDITPAPAHLTRAFVGRLEVITPEVRETVANAIRHHDQPTLTRFARFLEPIANELLASHSAGLSDADVRAAIAATATVRHSGCQ